MRLQPSESRSDVLLFCEPVGRSGHSRDSTQRQRFSEFRYIATSDLQNPFRAERAPKIEDRIMLNLLPSRDARQLATSSGRSREGKRPWATLEDNDLIGLLRPAGQFVHRTSMCAFNEAFGFHAAGVHARSANADLSAL